MTLIDEALELIRTELIAAFPAAGDGWRNPFPPIITRKAAKSPNAALYPLFHPLSTHLDTPVSSGRPQTNSIVAFAAAARSQRHDWHAGAAQQQVVAVGS
jgi:hypothetical protein